MLQGKVYKVHDFGLDMPYHILHFLISTMLGVKWHILQTNLYLVKLYQKSNREKSKNATVSTAIIPQIENGKRADSQ